MPDGVEAISSYILETGVKGTARVDRRAGESASLSPSTTFYRK